MKQIILLLFLVASAAAFAATNNTDKLSKLESMLNGVRQDQQSVYQNYQMAKELRLKEVEEGGPGYGTSINTPPPNYDDVVRAQLEREQRIQQYSDELKRLSIRYLELENQRKALVDQIRELAQHPEE
jgi:hypothetical protein